MQLSLTQAIFNPIVSYVQNEEYDFFTKHEIPWVDIIWYQYSTIQQYFLKN